MKSIPILTEQTSPAVEFAVQDNSDSNRAYLGTETKLVAATVPYLPHGAWLTILGVNSDCEQIRSAPAPSSDDDLIQECAPLLIPKCRACGTRLDLALVRVAERSKMCAGRIVIIIASDFFLDGVPPEGRLAIIDAAKSLAENPRVRAVFLVGMSPASGSDQSLLAPLGGKLHPFNLSAFDASAVSEAF